MKGSYVNANVADGSFFRILMPCYPAFLLLIAAVPLLLPHLPEKQRSFRPAFATPRPRTRWSLLGAAVLVSSIAPLAAFAASDPRGGLDPVTVDATFMPVPANIDLGLSASVHGRRVTLVWRHEEPAGGPVFFRVRRGRSNGFTCPAAPGAKLCKVVLPEVGVSGVNRFVDTPGKGVWFYRIMIAANWHHDPQYGDPYLVSRLVSVTVR